MFFKKIEELFYKKSKKSIARGKGKENKDETANIKKFKKSRCKRRRSEVRYSSTQRGAERDL